MKKRDWIIFNCLHYCLVEALKEGEISREELCSNEILDKSIEVLDSYTSDKYLKEVIKIYRQYVNKIEKEIKNENV